jgi:hypothetical protein
MESEMRYAHVALMQAAEDLSKCGHYAAADCAAGSAARIRSCISPPFSPDMTDKARLDWLNMRIVTVCECMASDTPLLFEHVPAGYGLRDDTDLRKSIDAAMRASK